MSQDTAVPPVKVLVDEKAKSDTAVSADEPSSAATEGTTSTTTATPNSATTMASSPNLSPAASPPVSPPVSPPEGRKSPNEDYYSSRGKFDRLGNPIPEHRRRPSAMASVYGGSKIRLPGDLGARDPRRPKSPAPERLPGDLGPNDPRRPKSPVPGSVNSSPAPSSHHTRHASDDGGVRLLQDPEPEHHDSDDDADADNDNDTDADENQRGRGRKRPEPGRTTSGKAVNVREDDSDDSEKESQFVDAKKPDPTKGESMRSFIKDSRIRISSPGMTGRRRVHPSTAFDAAPSGASTPMHSDDESQSELRAAQKLSLAMSAIHSTPSAHRVIRQIIRGDFEQFQREAEDGRKRQRMYLVATDMSPEAEYALEWTIGTVLRDGDTLFAVYAADEESVGASDERDGGGGVEVGHGAESVKDTAGILKGLPVINQAVPNSPGPSPLSRSSLGGSSQDLRSRSRGVYSSAETERRKALEGITERCVRLLRKTRLQVRVVVEVFHCKSPRHMITEVIDFLSPTLVIIGSRGRSAMKGVLLGSFSNYLVTKSSVPVMVARKKLRKHSKPVRNKDGLAVPYQGSGRSGRLSNVIELPKNKGLRVKGWDQVGID
ncbi:hypothetical protein M409DRAFT_68589 [Zasmidium cellare ATCC 36951]|uniref:UspA domain-containing protein n=1 Tax=Zasmidium cellare ATCC 36951 TaxID=1080233 RepID=A0A6A6C846_ZASCE|nr:uncharacterized protein M409DRAFT_68589 [Zasmidium cellare ATCC 36951]KAF2163314.1 hypothetical protein M409DRAFT_68589 [Zasmidium cellare ATCC 36951]